MVKLGGDRFLDQVKQGRSGLSSYLATIGLLWLLLLPFQFLKLSPGNGSQSFWASLNHYLLQNLPFAILFFGLWVALRWIHQRPFKTLITPNQGISYKRVFQGLGLWFLLLALTIPLQFLTTPSALHLAFHPLRWLLFLPFILVCTPLQAATEELLFRGYGLQAAGQLTRNRLFLIGFSGLIFAFAHLGNAEVSAGNSHLWAFGYYFVCGGFPTLVTLWDETLELAIGWHIANNLFVALFLQPSVSTLQTPTIWVTSQPFNFQTGFVLLLIQIAVFCILLLRRSESRFSQASQDLPWDSQP